MKGFFVPGEDVLVGKEYWDYLGGENTFEDFLKLFDIVGKKYHDKIQEKINHDFVYT